MKINPMIPARIRHKAAPICMIPWSGEEFTMYNFRMKDWQTHPISSRIDRDGFYRLSGHPVALRLIIADSAQISPNRLYGFLRGFLFLRGGNRLSMIPDPKNCIYRNWRFWLKWVVPMIKVCITDYKNSNKGDRNGQ